MANVTVTRRTRTSARAATSPDRILATPFVWAALRIALGFIFLWGFLDKVFGLGFPTEADGRWINGNSVTFGMMSQGSSGPLESFYGSIAGNVVLDWAVMTLGLSAGIALVMGAGVKIAATVGALIYVLMWSLVLPPVANPILDQNIVIALVLIGVARATAGRTWGVGNRWRRTRLVTRYPLLE